MLRPAIATLAAAAIGLAGAAAQGVVPPATVGPPNPIPGLTAWAPGVQVRHVHFVHLPGDPPEVFYGVLNVRNLPPALGGVSNWDFVAGRYDVLTDTFTPTLEAAPLNTATDAAHLTMHPNGLFAVFGREPDPTSRSLWLAARPAIGQPWQVTGEVFGSSPSTRLAAALAEDRGQTVLLHATGLDLARTPIDVLTATFTGPPVIIARPVGNSFAEAPVPITDPNGEVIGLSIGERTGVVPASVEHRLALDLEPATRSVLVHRAPTGSGPGGVIGGRFFNREDTPSGPSIRAIDTCWFTGGRAPIGGTMLVRMFSPPTAGTELYLTAFVASSSFLATGVAMPPLQGLVGVEPSAIWMSPVFIHDNRNGEAQTSFTIPNVPALSGARLPVQCATLEAAAITFYLGNTAWLRID